MQNIEALNKEISESTFFESRRIVKTTKTIFHDAIKQDFQPFTESPENWCIIPESLAKFMVQYSKYNRVIRIKKKEEAQNIKSYAYLNSLQKEISCFLRMLLQLIIGLKSKIVFASKPLVKAEQCKRMSILQAEINSSDNHFMDKKGIRDYICNYIDGKMNKFPENIIHRKTALKSEMFREAVLGLKKEGKYSVKEICAKLCISTRIYYEICRPSFSFAIGASPSNEPNAKINKISAECLSYIDQLVKDPHNSYNAKDIAGKIREHFGIRVSHRLYIIA